MAIDPEDFRSRFRHREVVMFINEEVLSDGGGLDFYPTFQLPSWNEIEDILQAIMADSLVPRAIKRACAWAALAMSLRAAIGQREQQVRLVWKLQERMEQLDAAALAMSSDLHRLQEEREEVVSQLHCAESSLRQVLEECDMLFRQLLQLERSAQAHPLPQQVVPNSGAQQHGSEGWLLDAHEPRETLAAGSQRGQDAESRREESRVAPPTRVLYVPGLPSPWAQVIQPPLPVPFLTPFPVLFPYSQLPPPRVVMEAQVVTGGSVPRQLPTRVICLPGLQSAVMGSQETAFLWDQMRQGWGEGPLRSHFKNPPQHSQNQGGPRNNNLRDRWPGYQKLQELCKKLRKLQLPACESSSGPSAAFISVRPQLAGAKRKYEEVKKKETSATDFVRT